MTYWEALITSLKHPINTISSIETGPTAGIGATIGAIVTGGFGASDSTLENAVFGTLSGDQKSKIVLQAQEENARAQGPKVYGNFLQMKKDLEAIFKMNDAGHSVTDSYGEKNIEPPPDLTNPPWKVLILIAGLILAFALLRK